MALTNGSGVSDKINLSKERATFPAEFLSPGQPDTDHPFEAASLRSRPLKPFHGGSFPTLGALEPRPGGPPDFLLVRRDLLLGQETLVVAEAKASAGQMIADVNERLRTGQLPAGSPISETRLPKGRLTGPVKLIRRIVQDWCLDEGTICILLGFESVDILHVRSVLEGYTSLRGRDMKDRVALLYQIRKGLDALFRDLRTENQWLRERQRVLGDKTPFEFMKTGSMAALLEVRDVVEMMSGR